MNYRDFEYDYECAIELFTCCNYRCEYCSGPRVHKQLRRGRKKEDIQKVIDFFNGMGKTWLIGMSGGEPSIHPHFYTLIDALKHTHFFYFFTNLSFDVSKFCDHVPPYRVQYIKASLHPEGNEEEFLYKFGILFEKGYNPILIMVSAPSQFKRISRISKICNERGWPFTLSVLEGPYRNKNYPNDFSEKECDFILRYTDEPGNLLRLLNKSPGGMNTYGLQCMAGRKSFCLDMEDGEIRTCESVKSSLGNIYTGIFEPREFDIICPAINGCVGYNRNIFLPNPYIEFFEHTHTSWCVKALKESHSFPQNLYEIIKSDITSSNIVDESLHLIFKIIENAKTMFWGAGIYGSKILYYLRESFGEQAISNVIGFIDSCPDRWGKIQLGLPVYSPEDPFVNNAKQILITSHAYEEDILEQAKKIGLEKKCIALHSNVLSKLDIKAGLF